MARVKAGIPTVSELVEGETEYRQVSGQGVISYTKNDNQLYSTRTYPTPIPPVIDKKESSSISNIVNISTTGELELDFSSLSSATLANGDFLMFLDTTSSYAVRKEAIADVATLFSGTGLTATNSVIAVDAAQTQITSVGTIGTGTWEGTTIAVAQGGTGATTLNNLITLGTHTEGSYVATLTAGTLIDLQNNSGENASPTVDVDLNEAAAAVMAAGDGIIFVDADDSNVAKQETLQDLLDTVAGTVATTGLDRSGATLVITDLHPVGVSGANNQLLTDDGDGTVTSESGLTYNGSTLAVTGALSNTTAADLSTSSGITTIGSTTALTVSAVGILNVNNQTDATSTTDGSLQTDGGLSVAKDAVFGNDIKLLTDNSIISMGDGGPFTITHSGDGATIAGLGALVVDSTGSTVTIDGHTGITLQSTSSGDILLDSAADVVLDAAGGNFEFKDAGTAQLTLDVDGTAGDIIFNLEVNGDDLVFTQYDNTEVLRLKDEATAVIRNSYITDHALNSKPASNGRHFATGDADYQQNYSWIGLYDQISSSSEHDADYGNWGES